MNEAAVRIEGLTKVYGSRGNIKAVDDLNLTMTLSTIYLAPESETQNHTVAAATGVQP